MIPGMLKVAMGGVALALGYKTFAGVSSDVDVGGADDGGDWSSPADDVNGKPMYSDADVAAETARLQALADAPYKTPQALQALRAAIQNATDPNTRATLEAELKRLTGS